MKKFLTGMIIYFIPLPLYLGLIFLLDPFNYYSVSNFISYETKSGTSRKVHPQLWKILEYKNLKTESIILGDSRSGLIHSESIKELSGMDVYNFAYSGGTLIDMIETFWYSTNIVKLKDVYIGINFNLYNNFEKNNHVSQAKTISGNFFTYSFSKVVFTTAFQCVNKQFFDQEFQIGDPGMSFEEFWKYHLDVNGRRFYQKYSYPKDLSNQLTEVSEYCRKNDINLVFFIPPNHVEWQQRKIDFGLAEEHKLFLDELNKLGKVYNFDTVNAFTSSKINFRDPVHPVNDSLIVTTIWGNTRL